MRIRQIALGTLVIVAAAAGFAARLRVDSVDAYVRVARDTRLPRPLSAYAPGHGSSDVGPRSDVDLRPLEIFYSALKLLREEYVEPVQKSQERDLAYGSLRVMLDSLHDPLTRFLEPEQARLVLDAEEGKFHGIGAILKVDPFKQGGLAEERLVVVTTLPGSPARKADLATGDVIAEIDGKTILPYDPFQRVERLIKQARNGAIDRDKLQKLLDAESERISKGVGFQKAQDMLAGDGEKEFTLTIVRAKAAKTVKVKVASATTVVDPVAYSTLAPSVGYIRINLAARSAEAKVAEAVATFRKHGVKGVAIDLRDCPGGTLEGVEALAGSLMPGKTLSVLQLPRGRQRMLKAASPSSASAGWLGPVVVIVNGGTSGLAEVLAAALHDSASAKLIGTRTAGSSLQQTFVPLRDGSAVTVTTGKYLSPKGADYRGRGLQADVEVTQAAGKPGEDPQLAKAVELLSSGKVKR